MATTMRELRQLIEDNCDFSQPLRVVSRDVGRKASKHSAVRVDENCPAMMKFSPGMYDDRGTIELTHYPQLEVLMPETVLADLDEFLEENPRALLKWVYFFYFPIDYVGLFGRMRRIDNCLLDTSNVKDIYFSDDEPDTLVIEAEYEIGSFD